VNPVVIGNATLYLGDCRDILPTLPKADVVITDPPYGIAWTKPFLENGNSRAHEGIANDTDTSVRDEALALCSGVRALVFGSFQAQFPADVRQVLIWQKPGDAGLFGTVAGYRRDIEPIFLCGKWPAEPVARSSVLKGKASFRGHAGAESNHPHVKPVDLLEKLILGAGATDVVLDPFMGSGSTVVACMNLGRRFIGCELDPAHFDTACRRIEDAQRQGRMFG
jgi:site-specific DNA-methyltransferase (adenine-specific)